jgi:hypothetical protein
MKNNFIKAAFVGFALFSSITIFANPFPNFMSTNWLSTIKTFKNNTESKKTNCVFSNVITITVYKCDEPIADNTSKKKDVFTASTRN